VDQRAASCGFGLRIRRLVKGAELEHYDLVVTYTVEHTVGRGVPWQLA
jgi:hypothetical protein